MRINIPTFDRLQDLYRRWSAFGGSCVDVWLDLVSDDFRLSSSLGASRHIEFSRDACGKTELIAYFEGFIGDWELIRFSISEISAADNRVVVVSRQAYRNRRTDKVKDGPTVHIWRFRDSKAIELQAFADTASGMREAASIADGRVIAARRVISR